MNHQGGKEEQQEGNHCCLCCVKSFSSAAPKDTLLNVFLAIAVDNLANAQELTKVGDTFL